MHDSSGFWHMGTWGFGHGIPMLLFWVLIVLAIIGLIKFISGR